MKKLNICANCEHFKYLWYQDTAIKECIQTFYKDSIGRCFKHPSKTMRGRALSETRHACDNYSERSTE